MLLILLFAKRDEEKTTVKLTQSYQTLWFVPNVPGNWFRRIPKVFWQFQYRPEVVVVLFFCIKKCLHFFYYLKQNLDLLPKEKNNLYLLCFYIYILHIHLNNGHRTSRLGRLVKLVKQDELCGLEKQGKLNRSNLIDLADVFFCFTKKYFPQKYFLYILFKLRDILLVCWSVQYKFVFWRIFFCSGKTQGLFASLQVCQKFLFYKTQVC